MRKILRKTLVVIILFASLFVNTDCKKQKKCGCGKDVISTFINSPSYVYFDGNTITMQTINDPYSYYSFCNIDEIMPKLEKFKSGDELAVSGYVYWDCYFVMQASNNPYQSYYNQTYGYKIQVTDIFMDMYGKDNSDETLKRAE